jgi:hypothetical protein
MGRSEQRPNRWEWYSTTDFAGRDTVHPAGNQTYHQDSHRLEWATAPLPSMGLTYYRLRIDGLAWPVPGQDLSPSRENSQR